MMDVRRSSTLSNEEVNKIVKNFSEQYKTHIENETRITKLNTKDENE